MLGGTSARPPEELANELHELIDQCDGILAAVGGWSLLPVLPHLNIEYLASSLKPIIGYSDLTSLVNLVAFQGGTVSFHGPMVLSEWGEFEAPWEYTVRSFEQVVIREPSSRKVQLLDEAPEWTDELLWWDSGDVRRRNPVEGGEGLRVIREGTAIGALWGGSLHVLGLTVGTPYWVPPENGILCLEAEAIAPDEYWARLEQFRQAGVFEEVAGVVVGKVSRPAATPSGFSDFDVILERVVTRDIPIVAGADIGHTEPMVTLPIGAECELTCTRRSCTLEIVDIREAS